MSRMLKPNSIAGPPMNPSWGRACQNRCPGFLLRVCNREVKIVASVNRMMSIFEVRLLRKQTRLYCDCIRENQLPTAQGSLTTAWYKAEIQPLGFRTVQQGSDSDPVSREYLTSQHLRSLDTNIGKYAPQLVIVDTTHMIPCNGRVSK